jgi:excisionase family DNA binding protein
MQRDEKDLGLEGAFKTLVEAVVKAADEIRGVTPVVAAAPPVLPSIPVLLLTTAQVAERCGGVHKNTVAGWIRSKRLGASKPGRTYLVAPAELERFLAAERAESLDSSPDVDSETARIFRRLGRSG